MRKRHDGVRRNPWDEVESRGHHYARSMSSWALLLALSGFHYNAARRSIAFAPTTSERDFRCFFSAGTGWGTFEQQYDEKTTLSASLRLEWGRLQLREVSLQSGGAIATIDVSLNGTQLPARLERSGSATLLSFMSRSN